MTLGKPSGKPDDGSFGFSRNFTPHDAGKARASDSTNSGDKKDPLYIPPEHKTLIGMPAVRPDSTVPPADPVAANSTKVSTSAMAAVEAPVSVQANFVRASDLFFKLVDARPQIARLCDFLDDPVIFDEQFREFCSDPAFLREVSYWLSNRIVKVQFVPNGPIEDGWLIDESIESKPEISARHGLLSVQVRKIDDSDPLTRKGTRRSVHLRRIVPHNIPLRG
ncbi:hypothetical protein IT413_05625 [Candidatus Peregrinibacteria bacterium]|nr:hypothetical protein [Candidatus Peregrinibacteria bacterium]